MRHAVLRRDARRARADAEKTEVPDAEHAAAADERTKDEQSETLDKVTEFERLPKKCRARQQAAAGDFFFSIVCVCVCVCVS